MYKNEAELEIHIRNIIENQICTIENTIKVLSNKRISDIVICKEKPSPSIFFIEVKLNKTQNGRIGIGHSGGKGFQTEIISSNYGYLKTHLLWIIVDKDRPDIFHCFSNDEIKKYVMGNEIGEKQNNLRKSILNEKGINEKELLVKLQKWFSDENEQEIIKITNSFDHWQVWEESIFALRRYQINQKDGEKEFLKLINKYPEDGMVLFEYGVALEEKLLYREAIQNYTHAEALFPIKRWREISRYSINRSYIKLTTGKYGKDDKWWFIYKINLFTGINPRKIMEYISAIEKIYRDEWLSLAHLRIYIEEIVFSLYQRYLILQNMPSARKERIRYLGRNEIIPEYIENEMLFLYDKTSEGIHPDVREGFADSKHCVHSFIIVLEFWDKLNRGKTSKG
jgi:hypothetical protein